MSDPFLARLRRRAYLLSRRLLVPPDPVNDRLEAMISVGRHTYPTRPRNVIHFGTYSARLIIGSYCSIAANVEFILDGDHRTDWVTTFPIRGRFPGFGDDWDLIAKGDIVVGNDVWLGWGATVLSGVTIGDGAVVAARAVVTRDVAPYTIVAGNPAVAVRQRFPDEVTAALLRIRWWEWDDDIVRGRVDELCGASVEAFVASYDESR